MVTFIVGLIIIALVIAIAAPIIGYGLMALFLFWPFVAAYFMLAADATGGVDWMEYWFVAIGLQVGWVFILGMMGKNSDKDQEEYDWKDPFR